MRKELVDMVINLKERSDLHGGVILDSDSVQKMGELTVGMLKQHHDELLLMRNAGFVHGAIAMGAIWGAKTIYNKVKRKQSKTIIDEVFSENEEG